MVYDFDFLLEKFGKLGRSQVLMVLGIYYYGFPAGFNAIQPVFTSYTPAYRCYVPEIDDNDCFAYTDTESFMVGVEAISPGCEDTCNGCERYAFNASLCTGCGDEACLKTTNETMLCDQGYVYDRSIFPETCVTEFDLVCDRIVLSALATSMYFLGLLLGSFVFGNVCDRIGRWPTMVMTCIFCFIFMFGAAFSSYYWLYVANRVLVSFFGYGTTISTFVYVMEIIGVEYRTLVGISFQISFALGYMTLSGLAYQWPDWHQLQMASLVFSIPFGVIAIILPESPRWLLSQEDDKKTEKAKKITNKMAKFNKKPLTEGDWKSAEEVALLKIEAAKQASHSDRKYTTTDLFRTKPIRRITYGVTFSWFVNSLVYYGITLNTGSLSGDIFINNVLGGVVEIVGYIVVILFMDMTGRRALLAIMLAIAGFALLICAILNEQSEGDDVYQTVSKACAFTGKMGISGSFAIIYLFTTELYPTVVRSNGIGTGSIAARCAGIITPFILILQYYVSWLPNVIFGLFSLVAAFFAFFLPDTTGIPMLETIEQAELFYAGEFVVPADDGGPYEEFGHSSKTSNKEDELTSF